MKEMAAKERILIEESVKAKLELRGEGVEEVVRER
jgi:hypothetical protein